MFRNTKIENMVGYFEKDIETRWLSKLRLLRSIQAKIDRLVALKNEENLNQYFDERTVESIQYINGMQRELGELIKIMQIFEKPINFFQVILFSLFIKFFIKSSAIPLIHAVWPYFLKMKKDCKNLAESGNSPFTRALAKSAFIAFDFKERRGFITKYHKMATFLHPAKRKLDELGLSQNEKFEVIITKLNNC